MYIYIYIYICYIYIIYIYIYIYMYAGRLTARLQTKRLEVRTLSRAVFWQDPRRGDGTTRFRAAESDAESDAEEPAT